MSYFLFNECGSKYKVTAKSKEALRHNINLMSLLWAVHWEQLSDIHAIHVYVLKLSTDASLTGYFYTLWSRVQSKDSFPGYYHPAARFITTKALDVALINRCSTPPLVQYIHLPGNRQTNCYVTLWRFCSFYVWKQVVVRIFQLLQKSFTGR